MKTALINNCLKVCDLVDQLNQDRGRLRSCTDPALCLDIIQGIEELKENIRELKQEIISIIDDQI